MKALSLTISILALLTVFNVSAADSAADSDVSQGEYLINVQSDLMGIDTGSMLPNTNYRQFKLVSFSSSASGVEFGCNGLSMGNIVGNVQTQIKEIFEYAKANIQGLALTWLSYSDPTLYNNINNLKASIENAININVATCSSIRQMRSYRDGDSNSSEALDKCIESGNSNAYCNNGNNLREYAPKYSENETTKKALKENKDFKPTGSSHDFIRAQIKFDPETDKFFTNHFPGFTQKDGGSSIKGKKSQLRITIEKRGKEFSNRLHEAIGKSVKKKGKSLDWESINKLQNDFPALPKITSEQMRAFIAQYRIDASAARNGKPRNHNYWIMIAKTSDNYAIAEAELYLGEIKMAIKTAIASGQSAEDLRKNKKIINHYNAISDLVTTELEIYKNISLQKEKQRESINSLIKIRDAKALNER